MAKRIPIKSIIFDLGGVVMHGGYLGFINHYIVPCLTPRGRKKIEDLEHRVNLGEITEADFYKYLHEVFGLHLSVGEMRRQIIRKMKTDRSLLRLIPQLPVRKVALFTNSIGHMAVDVMRSRKIPASRLFDRVFISSRIHFAKPDRAAYRYVLRKLRVRPNEALMVDDRLDNIKGARAAGLHGVLYRNAMQFKRALRRYSLI